MSSKSSSAFKENAEGRLMVAKAELEKLKLSQ